MRDPEEVADEQPGEERSGDSDQAKKRPGEHDRGGQDHLANRPELGARRQNRGGFDLDWRGVGMDIRPRGLSRAGNPLQSGRLNSLKSAAWLRIDGDVGSRHSADRRWLRIESRKGRIGIRNQSGERLRLRRPLRYTREALEKLGFDPQILGAEVGHLGRERRGDLLEVGRDGGRLGRSFGCRRAAGLLGLLARLLGELRRKRWAPGPEPAALPCTWDMLPP